MARTYSTADVFRGVSVVAVGVLTLALLPAPSYRTSRLVLVGLVAPFGWVGAAGAVWTRITAVLVSDPPDRPGSAPARAATVAIRGDGPTRDGRTHRFCRSTE